MELLFLINSFKLSSADVINVIIPYFFYSKGDQKDSHKRVPITAKLVTSLLKRAGADHVMIIEPHTPQLEGFFETPVDALKVSKLFVYKDSMKFIFLLLMTRILMFSFGKLAIIDA